MRLQAARVTRGGHAKVTSNAAGYRRADALLFLLYYDGNLCASQVLISNHVERDVVFISRHVFQLPRGRAISQGSPSLVYLKHSACMWKGMFYGVNMTSVMSHKKYLQNAL